MKLYDGGRAPNPRRVRIFMAEKGIEVDIEPIDMGAMGHRSEAVAQLNPLKRLPVLELDDGTAIAETVAICRYLEELYPEPAMFGSDALSRARIEMWQRRLEFHLLMLVANVFRHTHPAMKDWEKPQIKEFGEANRDKVLETLRFLDEELVNREWIAGDDFTIADITGLVALDFMKPARLEVPEELGNVLRWRERLRARPSANA